MTDLLRTWRQWKHAFVLHFKDAFWKLISAQERATTWKEKKDWGKDHVFPEERTFISLEEMQKVEITEKGSAQWHRSNCKGWSILIKIKAKLWKSSATFLKARSVLGGAFRPTVITLLPVNPWLPPVRFPNWFLSQIQRKMNIQPPFIHLSHPTKEDHLSIGRELLCHILCQSVLYTWHRMGNSEAQKVCTHTTFSYGRRPNIVWKGTKYCWRRDQILL